MTWFWISCGISWPLYNNIFPWHCCLWNLPMRVPEYHGTYLCCQVHGLLETSPVSCKPPVTSMPCLVSFQLAMFDCQSEQGWTCQSFFDGKIWEIRGNSGNIGFKKWKMCFLEKIVVKLWNMGNIRARMKCVFFSSQCFLNSEMAHKNCTFDKWFRANHNSSWKPNFTTCPPHSLLTNRPQAHLNWLDHQTPIAPPIA